VDVDFMIGPVFHRRSIKFSALPTPLFNEVSPSGDESSETSSPAGGTRMITGGRPGLEEAASIISQPSAHAGPTTNQPASQRGKNSTATYP